MELAGKVALITGASGGLGITVAESFAAAGLHLALTYRSDDDRKTLSDRLHKHLSQLHLEKADLTNEDDVVRLFAGVKKRFTRIDIVCNLVGGFMQNTPVKDLSLRDWEKMISLNLTTCFLSCREAVKAMYGSGYGRIINISAMPGLYVEPERGAYGLSKAGVAYLTRLLGLELKRSGITASALAPSVILTDANREWGNPDDIPYWVTPEEIADTMLNLCKEESRSINGAVIEIFGGVSAI